MDAEHCPWLFMYKLYTDQRNFEAALQLSTSFLRRDSRVLSHFPWNLDVIGMKDLSKIFPDGNSFHVCLPCFISQHEGSNDVPAICSQCRRLRKMDSHISVAIHVCPSASASCERGVRDDTHRHGTIDKPDGYDPGFSGRSMQPFNAVPTSGSNGHYIGENQ